MGGGIDFCVYWWHGCCCSYRRSTRVDGKCGFMKEEEEGVVVGRRCWLVGR